MKKFSHLMLIAIAAAFATPASAWDFKVTGSAVADFRLETTKKNTGAEDAKDTSTSVQKVTSEGGKLSLISAYKEGENSATFTYSLDYDKGLREKLKLEASTKKGEWTASASTAFDRLKKTDEEPFKTSKNLGDHNTQSDESTTAITLTNGTLTIKLGDTGHLSNARKSYGSVASGEVNLGDALGAPDEDLGANVGDFQGVSVGYKIQDGINVTVAYQAGADASIFGRQDPLAGEDKFYGPTGSREQSKYNTTGFGFNVDAALAGAKIAFTYGSGSTKNINELEATHSDGPTDNSTFKNTGTTKMDTYALGAEYEVPGLPLTAFLTYAHFESSGKTTGQAADNAQQGPQAKKTVETKPSSTGYAIGVKYALPDDMGSVVFNLSNNSLKHEQIEVTTATTTTTKTSTQEGMEIGYDTKVGVVDLGVGYGTKKKPVTTETKETDEDTTKVTTKDEATYFKVKLSYSF